MSNLRRGPKGEAVWTPTHPQPEPTTQAGKALLGRYRDSLGFMSEDSSFSNPHVADYAKRIAAIEAEAAAAATKEAVKNERAAYPLWARNIRAEAEAERDAANRQLAALTEALRETAMEAHIYGLLNDHGMNNDWQTFPTCPNVYCTNARNLTANLPAAAQEWLREHDDKVRVEYGWEIADRVHDQRGRWLDLASPDAERRLAAALNEEDDDPSNPWLESDARRILTALAVEIPQGSTAKQAASQPAGSKND